MVGECHAKSRTLTVQCALEIPIQVTIEMDAGEKNLQALKYEDLVREYYKEPVDGKFDDVTLAVLETLKSDDSQIQKNQGRRKTWKIPQEHIIILVLDLRPILVLDLRPITPLRLTLKVSLWNFDNNYYLRGQILAIDEPIAKFAKISTR